VSVKRGSIRRMYETVKPDVKGRMVTYLPAQAKNLSALVGKTMLRG
jgi:hypothetical protein